MATDLAPLTRKHVPSVPAALKALSVMRSQLAQAKTYTEIRKLIDAAQALKRLLRDVEEVQHQADKITLIGYKRINDEIERVPKATRPHRHPRKSHARDILESGRGALPVKKDNRSRLKKLNRLSDSELEEMADKIHESGKEATLGAILRILKEREIADRRAAHDLRAEKGGTVADLTALGKRFETIYADPPWQFKVWAAKGKGSAGGLAENHYATMSIEDMKKLPVGELAAKNCTLFMWAVMPELPGALEVLEAWGFEYKTMAFVWVKQNRNGEGLFTGMGYWTRANAELCLLATKGSPQRVDKNIHQVIVSPLEGHSKKPDEARKRIEKLVLGPYLELFAREPRPGWTTWGNELPVQEAAE